jgi:predicted transposase YbfD/YdcC
MNHVSPVTIAEHFSTLTDPRVVGRTDHNFIDIISIALCAVVCGADTWIEIEAYGKAKYDWLKDFLELRNGIPTQHTFRRLFIALSPDEFETCFLKWIQSAFTVTDGQVVPIDGKTLRRTHDRASGKAAVHMVSAWASEAGICLGQIKTNEKSNEITAIPELIDRLELEGRTVSIDAMGCQTKISNQIVDKGADYILALKGNQGNLSEQVKMYFEDARENDFKGISFNEYTTVDGDHGRIETRTYKTISDIDWLQGKENWKKLTTIVMVVSQRDINGEISEETRYYISSLKDDAEVIAKGIRGHWGIENGLHWKLDIGFREDECRKRKGHAAANFAVLRHIALNLLNQEKTMKAGTKAKRLRAGWDNDYLLKVLGN